ncbi:MAG: primosomal protein N', partial [Acidimicrobiales bacterium]
MGTDRTEPAEPGAQGRLFALEPGDPPSRAADPPAETLPEGATVARIVPDVSGLDKQFDYLVPAELVDACRPGSIVRIDLNG